MNPPVPVVGRGEPVQLTDDLTLTFIAIRMPDPVGRAAPVAVTLVALQDGVPVGHLKWHTEDEGEVMHLVVNEEMRRRGIASLMWKLAHEMAAVCGWPTPRHSRTRSVEGDAWARAVGGEVPPAWGQILPWAEMREERAGR